MALKLRTDNRGQAVVEYILMTSIVVGFFVALSSQLGRLGIGKKLADHMRQGFAMTYKYGDPRAKGYDEGSPTYHPRVVGGQGNLRIFSLPEPD